MPSVPNSKLSPEELMDYIEQTMTIIQVNSSKCASLTNIKKITFFVFSNFVIIMFCTFTKNRVFNVIIQQNISRKKFVWKFGQTQRAK